MLFKSSKIAPPVLRGAGRGALLVSASVVVFCAAASGALAQEADAPAQEASELADEQELLFDIMEFEVAGNTVLEPVRIQTVLSPFTGLDKRIPDVESARVELERAYRDAGFATVVVEVPPQDVRAGIVTLSVVEGRIDQVRVIGADYVLPSEIKNSLPGIRPGVVPNVPALQAQLANSNSRATRTVTPEFRAGVIPGTVDIDLVVEDRPPFSASFEVNDQYNRSTERWRTSASISYNNLWQRGHSANLFYQTAPQDPEEIQVISGSYYAPIGYSRTSLLGYIVQSNTDVATIGGLAVLGDGLNVGARVIHTLGASPRGIVQSLMFGADFKDYLDQIGLVDPATGETLTFDTPITYLPFTGQYRLIGGRPALSYEISVAATFAVEGLVGKQSEFGGTPDNPLRPGDQSRPGKRADAEASFLYLSGSLVQRSELPLGLNFQAAVDWQLAPAPLISNEQFALGGLSSVRGYREAEALGDSGFRVSGELTRQIPLSFLGDWTSAIQWRVGGFAEAGVAWINDPLPGERSNFSLSSVGLTSRIDVADVLYGQLDLAYQFQQDPGGSGSPVPDDLGSLRLHAKLGLKY